MRRNHGVDLSGHEASFLEKSLKKRVAATGCITFEDYLQRLTDDGGEAAEFSGSLRVTYSEFFRDTLVFAMLEQVILPDLVAEKARKNPGEIRIWSAGCAAGQEAFSVAILLDELSQMQPDKPVAYRIFGTDLSELELARARAGVYSHADLKNMRLRHLTGCFSRKGENYFLAPRIRDRVDFSSYDLLDGSTACPPASIYGNLDIVLCCNVLLYYSPEARQMILNKVADCLEPGGYLVTGETERQIVRQSNGFCDMAPDLAVFRKG